MTTHLIHADWGKSAQKRWTASATRDGSAWIVEEPALAPTPRRLLSRVAAHAKQGPVMIGFDFPIGVPEQYARTAGIESYRRLLQLLGDATGPWSLFFSPASTPEQISHQRPFYPAKPGGTSQAHLTAGLRVPGMSALLRQCERQTAERPAANALFWTLGPKQVGHAAITGWREFLVPAVAQLGEDLAIWPFDGSLLEIASTGRPVTVVETYPAEACLHVGVGTPGKGWSKRRREDRIAKGRLALTWLADKPIRLTTEAALALEDGFGADDTGEDPFDAMIGLLSMIAVDLGLRPDGAPDTEAVRRWEGWILGQPGLPA